MIYFFSIIIPVYNTEKYLPRALDSVVNQTFDHDKIECVIVNDASPNTNACENIVQLYSTQLHITYLKHEQNKGLYLARKTGILNCSGDYILFLDPDDTYEKETCEVLSSYTNKGYDYVQFKISQIVNNEKQEFAPYYMSPQKENISLTDILCDKAMHNMVPNMFNAQFLKDIYKSLPEFYIVNAEDYYQFSIINYFKKNKKYIDKYLYNYYVGIGVTKYDNFNNANKFYRIDKSFQNMQHYLTDFFVTHNEQRYKELVDEYCTAMYLYFLKITQTKEVAQIICSRLSKENIVKYIIETKATVTVDSKNSNLPCTSIAKKIIKAILPYGVVRLIQTKNTKK